MNENTDYKITEQELIIINNDEDLKSILHNSNELLSSINNLLIEFSLLIKDE